MKNAKQERRENKKCLFVSLLSVVTRTWQIGSKSCGAAESPAVPEATKEATLLVECVSLTTIVSLQYRWGQAARCQCVTVSLSVCLSLPNWSRVAQLLTAVDHCPLFS